jgi:predicted MFS family arabinose efflux permease
MGGMGLGALTGSLALAFRMPPPNAILRSILAGVTLLGVGLCAIGFVHAEAVVVSILFLCGASGVYAVALCNTSIQQRIPDAMRGRVLSMYTFAFFAFVPFGNLFGGIMAERWGYAEAFAVFGGALLLSVGGVAAAMKRS